MEKLLDITVDKKLLQTLKDSLKEKEVTESELELDSDAEMKNSNKIKSPIRVLLKDNIESETDLEKNEKWSIILQKSENNKAMKSSHRPVRLSIWTMNGEMNNSKNFHQPKKSRHRLRSRPKFPKNRTIGTKNLSEINLSVAATPMDLKAGRKSCESDEEEKMKRINRADAAYQAYMGRIRVDKVPLVFVEASNSSLNNRIDDEDSSAASEDYDYVENRNADFLFEKFKKKFSAIKTENSKESESNEENLDEISNQSAKPVASNKKEEENSNKPPMLQTQLFSQRQQSSAVISQSSTLPVIKTNNKPKNAVDNQKSASPVTKSNNQSKKSLNCKEPQAADRENKALSDEVANFAFKETEEHIKTQEKEGTKVAVSLDEFHNENMSMIADRVISDNIKHLMSKVAAGNEVSECKKSEWTKKSEKEEMMRLEVENK